MESFLWHLANRTAETQFIFNLFHFLLAGLTLLVLLHQFRTDRADLIGTPGRLLLLGFLLLVLHFTLLALHFGAEFFLHKEFEWAGFELFSQGFLAWGLLIVSSAFPAGAENTQAQRSRWTFLGSCGVVGALLLFDGLFSTFKSSFGVRLHSVALVMVNLVVVFALGSGVRAVLRGEEKGRRAGAIALASVGLALLLLSAQPFVQRQAGTLLWNAGQHMLSVSLFAFAWAAGERSYNLLARIFVRLNLTFIILASLIMLITAGMEKYQYLRLAEERSMTLAEFLRGHVVYYRGRGEGLDDIFRHAEVLRRIVVEFGTLPELREVNVYLDGRRASFRYNSNWEIKEEIVSLVPGAPTGGTAEIPNSFQMIRLPLEEARTPTNQVELVGTMDFINRSIGKYIILIYSLFTIMVGLATGIIGIIVTDADRRLRAQYAELQETHQQLTQAAKLASVGQLAGGMAHEINNPITSILSLATHLATGKSAATLSPHQGKCLQVIAQQAERVSRIVGNLLMFARQSRLEVSHVDVGQLLNEATLLVQFRLRDNAIRLRRDVDAKLPVILGDASRLTEVFVNLLNNAIDAMPTGGMLVVRASSDSATEGGIRVEVKDTGCGIPPELLSRVFDPFFTTKEPGQGTGLGLSISHGIVKDHGGQIWAESQPGVGTSLVVTLPKEMS